MKSLLTRLTETIGDDISRHINNNIFEKLHLDKNIQVPKKTKKPKTTRRSSYSSSGSGCGSSSSYSCGRNSGSSCGRSSSYSSYSCGRSSHSSGC